MADRTVWVNRGDHFDCSFGVLNFPLCIPILSITNATKHVSRADQVTLCLSPTNKVQARETSTFASRFWHLRNRIAHPY